MDLETLSQRNPVRIGYYDPFDVYPRVREEVQNRLPLTNLHWKQHPLQPLKSIPLLPVSLVEEVPKAGQKFSQANAYLRLMFVCFDSIDIYRSQVRPLIKAWLASLVKGSEWAIIFCIPASGKERLLTIMKTSFFDKLRSDFGPEGKELPPNLAQDQASERCIKLREKHDDNIQKLEAYNDLMLTVKTLLLNAFNTRYQQLNEQLSRQNDAFAKFALQIELADLLSDMRLLKDALEMYNQLFTDLNHLVSILPQSFDYTVKIPDQLNGYKFENYYELDRIKTSLVGHKETKINLLEARAAVFISQSVLLQLLANYANSISISGIYVSTLFQKVGVFLNDVSATFNKDSSLNEWLYVIIDNYLQLPVSDKLFALNDKNNEQEEQNYQLNEILEFKGELKLFARTLLTKIAAEKGLAITTIDEALEEIKLDDDKPSEESNGKDLTYQPLVKALVTEESYYDFFEKLTELVIHDLVTSGRSKTIDILSIDLAILNYKRKNFTEALNILQDSYEFFIQHGWSFMGGILLEIYLDCVEKTKSGDDEHIITTCLKLFSNLIDKKNSKYGINNYHLTKKTSQISQLFEKVVQYSSKLEGTHLFPVSKIFDTTVLPYIKKDSSYKSYIELELTNAFGIEFDLARISLHLRSTADNKLPQLSFKNENVHISNKEHHTIKVYTNTFISGPFKLDKLIIEVNANLHFILEYEKSSGDIDPDSTTIQHSKDSVLNALEDTTTVKDDGISVYLPLPSEPILYYQNFANFRCEVITPIESYLGSTECQLRITNGHLAVKNVRVEKFEIEDGLDIKNGELKAETIDANQQTDFIVSYVATQDKKIISVKVVISYECEGEKFAHVYTQTLDTTLTVSVSVQDIFKAGCLFSKFQVGTSNPRLPIRVIASDLTTSDSNYEIASSPSLTKGSPIVTFGEQPASFFYKISVKDSYTIKLEDTLELKLRYSNLQFECAKILQDAILSQFQQLGLTDYWYLFYFLVYNQFKFDLNNFAIYLSVTVSNKEEMAVMIDKLALDHVSEVEDRKKVSEVFRAIFDKEGLHFVESEPRFENRVLHISVPVPILKVLQIAGFEYERHPQYAVGEPILMMLNVESVTRWSGRERKEADEDISILAASSPRRTPETKTKEEFQIMIQNDDNWLISGLKRQSFEVDYDELVTKNLFQLVLIPLNVGKLLLPRIQIKLLTDVASDTAMDVDMTNGSETLLVVPELDSITFSF